jgi:hypothetical protein
LRDLDPLHGSQDGGEVKLGGKVQFGLWRGRGARRAGFVRGVMAENRPEVQDDLRTALRAQAERTAVGRQRREVRDLSLDAVMDHPAQSDRCHDSPPVAASVVVGSELTSASLARIRSSVDLRTRP